MKSSPLLPLLLGLILFACNPPEASTPLTLGTYESIKPSYPTIIFHYVTNRVRSYGMGSTLTLQPDSSFQYTTCGNIMSGTWQIQSDSLLLTLLTNQYKNASLNKHGLNGKFPKVPKEPLVFIIGDKELTHTWTLKDGKKALDILRIAELESKLPFGMWMGKADNFLNLFSLAHFLQNAEPRAFYQHPPCQLPKANS